MYRLFLGRSRFCLFSNKSLFKLSHIYSQQQKYLGVSQRSIAKEWKDLFLFQQKTKKHCFVRFSWTVTSKKLRFNRLNCLEISSHCEISFVPTFFSAFSIKYFSVFNYFWVSRFQVLTYCVTVIGSLKRKQEISSKLFEGKNPILNSQIL